MRNNPEENNDANKDKVKKSMTNSESSQKLIVIEKKSKNDKGKSKESY